MKIVVVGICPYSITQGANTIRGSLHGHAVAFTRQLLPFLLSKKHQVCLIVPDRSPIHDSSFFWEADILPKGLALIPFSNSISPTIPSFFTFYSALSQAYNTLKGIDWVMTIYTYPFSVLVEMARDSYHYRTMMFIRGADGYGFLDQNFLTKNLGIDTPKHYKDVYKSALNKADYVFTTSNWLKNKVEQLGVTVSDVVPAPALKMNYRNKLPKLHHIKNNTAELLQPFCSFGKLDPEKNWLLSASRFSTDKQLDLIINSFFKSRMKNWQLVLSGFGPLQSEIINLVKENRSSSQVAILFTYPEFMAQLLSCANAYIHTALPSKVFIDSRPSSVTTAAFYGKPIIVPLAKEGGVIESVSKENILHFGFKVGRNKETTITHISKKIQLLDKTDIIDTVGQANKNFAAKWNTNLVFSSIEELFVA